MIIFGTPSSNLGEFMNKDGILRTLAITIDRVGLPPKKQLSIEEIKKLQVAIDNMFKEILEY